MHAGIKRSLTMIVLLSVGPPLTTTQGQSVVATIPSPSLTEQIDHYLSQDWAKREVEAAPLCSDRDFVRRLYLDVAGRVPTVQEVDAFLADDREDKRAKLADVLLESEDYVQHLADVMDALLMGRADESKYEQRSGSQWRSYLENCIRESRPWNEVVAEILLARPNDDANKGAVWFLYERNNDHQAIAEAIAPAFFGLRIECAQCHDHMMADEIKQQDYWGLVAFFNRGQNKQSKRGPRIAESAIGGFSEFADLTGDSHPNVLTFLGSATVEETRPGAGEKEEDKDSLYDASPDETPRVPKFSRRQAFVDRVVSGNQRLAPAMVNRIWAMLMGRGIVHPFDEMDSMHPPSHPDLLKTLAESFVSDGYDMRTTIRAIVLSQGYQLSSLRPEGVDDPASFAWYLERPLTAEQLARSIQLTVRGSFRNDDPLVGQFRQQFLDVLPDSFVAPVRDALYLSNHPSLDQFLRESNDPNHLRGQLVQLHDHGERADRLFATIYHRPAGTRERDAIAGYLEQRESNLESALDQVIWSMLTSAEFRLNH